ncbi:unnamed protein product, partial [Adineta steineri]
HFCSFELDHELYDDKCVMIYECCSNDRDILYVTFIDDVINMRCSIRGTSKSSCRHSDSDETLSDGNERTISSDELESSGSEGNDSLIEEFNQSSMDYWEWKVVAYPRPGMAWHCQATDSESISNDADPTTTTDDKELIPKWFERASSMIVETKPVEL